MQPSRAKAFSYRERPHFPGLVFALACVTLVTALQGCGESSPATGTRTHTTAPPPLTVTATSVTYPTAGEPFQALPTSSGEVLVSVTANGSPQSLTGVQIFTPGGGGGLQSSCVNPLSPSLLDSAALFANIRLSPNGAEVAGGIGSSGAIFYKLSALQSCTADGIVVSQGPASSNEGTLDVAVTPDGKFAFISNESGIAPGATSRGNIGVVALQRDASGAVTTGSTLLGQIATGGNAIAGMKLSPDGKRLYVTSEIRAPGTLASASSSQILTHGGCVQQPGSSSVNGLLTVINTATAESVPGPAAVLATVNAGCSPVRIVETADNSTLWVAARGDNRALAFSTALLESSPDNALLGYADTGGTAPVGLTLFHNEQLLAVTNSNRFGTGVANMTILYVANPASATVVTTMQTGLFPREVTVGADDATLYVTNFQSGTLEVISTVVK